jgi:hypothetical protein
MLGRKRKGDLIEGNKKELQQRGERERAMAKEKERALAKGREKAHPQMHYNQKQKIELQRQGEKEKGRFDKGKKRGNVGQGERKSFGIGERKCAPPDAL